MARGSLQLGTNEKPLARSVPARRPRPDGIYDLPRPGSHAGGNDDGGPTRIINNSGHGAQVDGSGAGIYLHKCFFSQSGQAATGTVYDINWSGTATGHVLNAVDSSQIRNGSM